MPTRTKPADRTKHADERSDLWVRTPYWDKGIEEAYEIWLSQRDLSNPWAVLLKWVGEGFSVSVREYDGAYCCTVSDADRKRGGKPCLLSGWGESVLDAMLVVDYKHMVLLDADWDNSSVESSPRKRR